MKTIYGYIGVFLALGFFAAGAQAAPHDAEIRVTSSTELGSFTLFLNTRGVLSSEHRILRDGFSMVEFGNDPLGDFTKRCYVGSLQTMRPLIERLVELSNNVSESVESWTVRETPTGIIVVDLSMSRYPETDGAESYSYELNNIRFARCRNE